MNWTKHDSASAQEEGWDIFFSEGSQDGDWQVQRLDEKGILDSEERAWELVGSQTTEVQKKAVLFIKAHNLQEMRHLKPYIDGFISFGELGVNLPFKFHEGNKVMVKIDESRYIFIGESGSHSVTALERELLQVYPV